MEIILWRGDDLDILLFDKGKPIHNLIAPVKTKRTWSNNNDGPVFTEEITDRYSLNGLANTHFITNQTSSEVINTELDSHSLEIV